MVLSLLFGMIVFLFSLEACRRLGYGLVSSILHGFVTLFFPSKKIF